MRRRGRHRPAALALGRRPHGGAAEGAARGWVAAVEGYRGGVNLGTGELLIVLIVVLVLFGGAKLPKLARSLGQAQSEFKKGLKEPVDDDEDTPTA